MAMWFARLALVVSLMASAASAMYVPRALEGGSVVAGDYPLQMRQLPGVDSLTNLLKLDAGILSSIPGIIPREVYSPKIVEPSSSTVWTCGKKVAVVWYGLFSLVHPFDRKLNLSQGHGKSTQAYHE